MSCCLEWTSSEMAIICCDSDEFELILRSINVDDKTCKWYLVSEKMCEREYFKAEHDGILAQQAAATTDPHTDEQQLLPQRL